MSIDRALQFNTAALAVMGAVFLALGHESTVVPLLLALAAVSAVSLTDVLHWLRLNRLVANGIAVLAVIWSLRDFLSKGSDLQLLAIANMLVFLQVVLLFQEKTARVYWQLLVLSLLQVVVAAALDLGPQFGILLSVYIVMALSALVLLCVYRGLHPEGKSEWVESGTRSQETGDRGHEGVDWRVLMAGPVVGPMTLTEAEANRGFTRRMIVRQVGLLAGATFVFTTVFFYITPRLSEATWQGPRGKGATMGFVPEVRLEQSGRIHLSQQVVMRVALTKDIDRKSVELVGDPYFQGTALTEYVNDERGSRWIWKRALRRTNSPQITSTNLVRQDIVIETANSPSLFAMWPVVRLNDTPRELGINRSLYHVFRRESDNPLIGRQFRYAFGTPAIKSSRQLNATPHMNRVSTFQESLDLELELKDLLVFDVGRFPKLAATAERTVRDQELEEGPALQKALALERHFQVQESYSYSLNLDVQRDKNLDPIEDFVANHRTGHCEYFASALVLMLRSQGIPARMVTGFKGGKFNALGRYYVVQQRHAHSWVEAWFPAGEVPEGEIAGPISKGGHWYRLDPTPREREAITASDEEGLLRRVEQAFDYVELLWRDYVLSLNASRQQDVVYDPLTEQATAVPAWTGGRQFQRWLRRWSRRLGIELPRGDRPNRVFQWEGMAIVIGGIMLTFTVVQVHQAVGRRLKRWLGWARTESDRMSRPPEFYRKLERLLARAALRRQSGQTPRELAMAARDRLANEGDIGGIANLPNQIVEAYYRVRFGGGRLDKEQMDAIEQALDQLAPAVSHANQR